MCGCGYYGCFGSACLFCCAVLQRTSESEHNQPRAQAGSRQAERSGRSLRAVPVRHSQYFPAMAAEGATRTPDEAGPSTAVIPASTARAVPSSEELLQLSAFERVRLCAELLALNDDGSLLWACRHLAALLSDDFLSMEGLQHFGAILRDAGTVECLCALLTHPQRIVYLCAMHILGNLASADSKEQETRQRIRSSPSGGLHSMLSHLHSEDPDVVFYAIGMAMNCCTTAEDASVVHEGGRHLPRIIELANGHHPMIAQFASAMLHNLQTALGHAQVQRAYEAQMRVSAVTAIQSAVRGQRCRRWVAKIRRGEPDEGQVEETTCEGVTSLHAAFAEKPSGIPLPAASMPQFILQKQKTAAVLRSRLAEVAAKEEEERALAEAAAEIAAKSARATERERAAAATRIQSTQRGRRIRSLQKVCAAAAIRMEAVTRGKRARAALQRQKDAAIVIQSIQRGRQAQEVVWRLRHAPRPLPSNPFQMVEAASVRVQSRCRIILAKRKAAAKAAAVRRIQAGGRGRTARREIASRHAATTTLQANARALLDRRQVKALVAAIRLQAGARGRATRKHIASQNVAALTLQARFRGQLGRKRAVSVVAAITVQASARRQLARKRVRTISAAITLQAGERGRKGRTLVSSHRLAACTVQTAVRGRQARRQASARTTAIIVMQAGVRVRLAHQRARLRIRAAKIICERARRFLRVRNDKIIAYSAELDRTRRELNESLRERDEWIAKFREAELVQKRFQEMYRQAQLDAMRERALREDDNWAFGHNVMNGRDRRLHQVMGITSRKPSLNEACDNSSSEWSFNAAPNLRPSSQKLRTDSSPRTMRLCEKVAPANEQISALVRTDVPTHVPPNLALVRTDLPTHVPPKTALTLPYDGSNHPKVARPVRNQRRERRITMDSLVLPTIPIGRETGISPRLLGGGKSFMGEPLWKQNLFRDLQRLKRDPP